MKMKTIIGLIVCALSFGLTAGEVTVTGVTAHQRYPWNGMVDIAVTMQGASSDVAKAECTLVAEDGEKSVSIEHITRNGADVGSGGFWVRKFVWDAKSDVGAVKLDDVALMVRVEIPRGSVRLWENGPFWSECNVGATKPEESGYYFWWGDTVGYQHDGKGWNAVDGSQTGYSFDGCPTHYKSDAQLQSEGYVDLMNNLTPVHDAATAHLGALWRMPTFVEFEAMVINCTSVWTNCNGVSGLLVSGKACYASNSIFMPATGYVSGTTLLTLWGNPYWSSTPVSNRSGNYAKCLRFASGGFAQLGGSDYQDYRRKGIPVRPILSSSDDLPGVSTHFELDCREGVRQISVDGEKLPYDVGWYKDADEIHITDNGIVVAAGLVGNYAWRPSSNSSRPHLLKLEAIKDGKVVKIETVELSLGYVRNAVARQLWPYNKVEIRYEVADDIGEMIDADSVLSLRCGDAEAKTVLGDISCSPGVHRVIWDLETDGVSVSQRDVQIKLVYETKGGLVHRWSFNGNLTDSVGGKDAVAVGSIQSNGSQYTLPGGGTGIAYITVGDGAFPTNDNGLTVELWATQRSAQYYSHIINLGGSSCIAMEWSLADMINCDEIGVPEVETGNGGFCTHLAPYSLGQEYHIAIVVKRQDNGGYTFEFYKQNGLTGETEKKVSYTSSPFWSWNILDSTEIFLGYGANDANASYNELRVWNKVMSEDALRDCARSGPDAALIGADQSYAKAESATEPTMVDTSLLVYDGMDVDSVMKLEYSSVGANVAKIDVDGQTLLSSSDYGAFSWQPQEVGTHTLVCTVGSNVWTRMVNVTNLDFVAAALPNPPGDRDESIMISSDRKDFTSANKGVFTFSVTSTAGTGTWAASVSHDWIALSKTNGTIGVDKVAYVVAANANAGQRTGYVYVNGHVHTIVQPGKGATLSTEVLNAGPNGLEQEITITVEDGAEWNARPESQWISVRPTSGIGSGTVTVQVAPFCETEARNGSATIAGKTVSVVQRGREVRLGCATTNCTAAAKTLVVDVHAISDTSWSVVSGVSWISVLNAGSGLGDSSVTLSIAQNESYLSRTGTVAIGMELLTVTQAGCTLLSLAIGETSAAVVAGETKAKTLKITATPDLPWTVTSDCNWVAPYDRYVSGAGTATIVYSVAANPTLAARTGHLTITPPAGSGLSTKTLTVTQAAASSSLSETEKDVTPLPTTVSVGVTVADIVQWSIVSKVNWVTINGVGNRTGPQAVNLIVAGNTTTTAREGVVTIAGIDYTIRQAGGTISVNKTAADVGALGGSVSVGVSATENLIWTIQNSLSWVTVSGESTRTGSASLVLNVSENTALTPREGTLTIGGATFTLRQAGGGVTLSLPSSKVASNGGTINLDVSGSANLNWSIQNAADWVTVEGATSRKGPTTLVIHVEANTGVEVRSCEIVIGGQTFVISQEAAGVVVASDVLTYGADMDYGTFDVTAPDYLTWGTTTEENWIFLTTAESTTGPGTVEYIVDELTDDSSRIGIIWVGSMPVYVCQSAVETTTLGAASREVSRLAGSGQITVAVDVGTGWCAMSTVPWITLGKTAGAEGEALQYSYLANTTGVARVGRILVNDQVFTLTQTHVDPSVPCWTIAYENLKGAANPNPDIYAQGEGVVFAALPNVPGYAFAGWTPSAIGTTESGAKTVRANWTANSYAVAFDANEGTGTMADLAMVYDTAKALTQNTFARTGYSFAGWATNAQGEVVYADKAQVNNLSADADTVVTLYAKWAPVSYTINYAGTKGAANSNPTAYTVEDAVTFAALPNVAGYTFVGWTPASIAVGTTGDIVVQAQWRHEVALADMVSAGIAQKTLGGNANWYEQTAVKHSGTSAWRSGAIGNDQSSWTEIQFEGANELSFWWKVSSEGNYDWLSWSLDGVEQSKISGIKDWVQVKATVSGNSHTVRFTYYKDVSQAGNDDCGWIDDIVFVCPETVNVTFDMAGKGVRSGGGSLRQTVDFGGVAALPTVTPNVGWQFDGWPSIGSIYKDTTFTASYTAIAYAIDYRNVEGAVNPNPTTYTIEDSVAFSPLTGIANYTFAGWTPSSIAAGSTGDKVVTANWNWTPQDATVEASITGDKNLKIKADWVKTGLDQRFGAGRSTKFHAKFGGDFAAALTKKTGKKDGAGNELSVWHDYVAGTDPTDSNSVFKASVKIVGGFPIVEWDPNLNSNGDERVYTVYGKNALGDSWHSPTNANDHFFKVDVAMPPEGTVTFDMGGATGTVEPVTIRVGQAVGELPTPMRSGYQFLGWYTEAEGGNQVTSGTVVSADMTIYAHWKVRLVHRWSFNGNLNDSVGGQTAQYLGSSACSWTSDGKAISLAGDGYNVSGVDLGSDLLPTNGSPVTIEVWARKRQCVGYCNRVLEIGCSDGGKGIDSLQIMWDLRSTTEVGEIQLRDEGKSIRYSTGGLGAYDAGTYYHVSIRIEPNSVSNSTVVTFMKRDAVHGLVLSSLTWEIVNSEWRIPMLSQQVFYLGHSLWSRDDKDAAADYDEVRIWGSALTDAELTASVIAGPDADL